MIGKVFAEIKVIYIENLPVKVPLEKEMNSIGKNVHSILSLKSENPSADSSTLESEIDQLVYQLYGLTKEEIKIVENR